MHERVYAGLHAVLGKAGGAPPANVDLIPVTLHSATQGLVTDDHWADIMNHHRAQERNEWHLAWRVTRSSRELDHGILT